MASSPESSMNGGLLQNEYWPSSSHHPYRTAVNNISDSSSSSSNSRFGHTLQQYADSTPLLPGALGISDASKHEYASASTRRQPHHEQATRASGSAHPSNAWTRTASDSSASSHSYYNGSAQGSGQDGLTAAHDSGLMEAGWSRQPMSTAMSSTSRGARQASGTGSGSGSYNSAGRQRSPTRPRALSNATATAMARPHVETSDHINGHMRGNTQALFASRPGTADDSLEYGHSSYSDVGSSSFLSGTATPKSKQTSSFDMDGSPTSPPSGTNPRNFLIPINGTGARQKLSILSASQRPRSSQQDSRIPSESDLAYKSTGRHAGVLHPDESPYVPEKSHERRRGHTAPDRDIGWDDDTGTPRKPLRQLSASRDSYDNDRSRERSGLMPQLASPPMAPGRSHEQHIYTSQQGGEMPRGQMTWNGRPQLRSTRSELQMMDAGGSYSSHVYSHDARAPIGPMRSSPKQMQLEANNATAGGHGIQRPTTPSFPGGKSAAWKSGLKNIFTKSAKEPKAAYMMPEDASSSFRGRLSESENERSQAPLGATRLSPNSKAYAILGEVPSGPIMNGTRDGVEKRAMMSARLVQTRRDEMDEIARAGWTAYQPRKSSERPGQSHTADMSTSRSNEGRDRSASASSGSDRRRIALARGDSAPSLPPALYDARGISQRVPGEPKRGDSLQADPWAQMTGRRTPNREPDAPRIGDSSLQPSLYPSGSSSMSSYASQSSQLGTSQTSSFSGHSNDDHDESRSKTPVPSQTASFDRHASSANSANRRQVQQSTSSWSTSSSNSSVHTRPQQAPLLRKASAPLLSTTSNTDESSDSTQRPTSKMSMRSDLTGAVPQIAAERPAVPLTSPLLASILTRTPQDLAQTLGQTIGESQHIPSEKAETRPCREKAKIIASEPSTPVTTAKPRPQAAPPAGPVTIRSAKAPPKAKTPTTPAPKPVDASNFVPADAFKLTRKGVPVQPVRGALDNALASHAGLAAGGHSRSATNGSDSIEGTLRDEARSTSYSLEDETSVDAVNLLPASAWTEVDTALLRFKAIPPQNASDKGALLRTVLLPFLALEAETPDVEVSGAGPYIDGKARRRLFFDWIRNLLVELRSIQTSADRGAILESIACIIESRNFSSAIVSTDAEDQNAFYNALSHIISYAIGELNKKGVYQNTLIFSGRLLAVAFFRIQGVASKLLRSLPVNRFALGRVAAEAEWDKHRPKDFEAFRRRFPVWLQEYCFDTARAYLKTLDTQSGQSEEEDRFLVRQASIEVEMSGNWLRRWQSDDSELFFSFCRSYHRQLSALFSGHRASSSVAERKLFFGGPGYAHLATCIHQKCLSLVHRDILSVTTLSSQKNFNPGETANVLSGSTAGKPRHLEAANRRCTAIVVDIIRSTPATSAENSIFASMLGLHVKCLVKRTSLFDVQGVFCLLDWMDGVLTHMENAEMSVSTYIDVGFLLDTIWLLLKDADHALALMRTVAFCYSNFAVLTSTKEYRIRFLEKILLDPIIFKKLFLSWSFTIRAYFLHLLVFRLARINDFDHPDDDPKGKTAIRVVRLFNQRLDEIRKRHDEFSPQASAGSQSEDEDDIAKRRRASFVSTIKRTPSVHQVELSPANATKAERILGIGTPDPALAGSPGRGGEKAQSRAAKWFRVLGGNKAGKQVRRDELPSPSAQAQGLGLFTEGHRNSSNASLNSGHSRESMEHRALMGRFDELDTSLDSTPERTAGSEDSQGDDEPLGALQASLRKSEAPSVIVRNNSAESEPSASAPLGEHLSEDISFDLQNASTTLPLPGIHGGSDPMIGENGAPRVGPHSPQRVSRAFSRRRSMLPGHVMSLVAGDESSSHHSSEEAAALDDAAAAAAEDEQSTQDTDIVCHRKRKPAKAAPSENNATTNGKFEEPSLADTAAYDRTLHIYAVQSLREYEQTVQEHDDFFASQPASAGAPQVPRLPIQWPAMWTE